MPQLRALGAAVAAATVADGGSKDHANGAQGRGSNCNRGVGDPEDDTVAASKRETHDAKVLFEFYVTCSLTPAH